MDCKKAVRDYLLDLIDQTGEASIKTLILDEETTKITSLSFSQSDLLKKEIYLFERLDMPKRANMQNVTAIVFVRPTRENFDLLIKELRKPSYKTYHIYFSSTIDRQNLKELAESDVNEVVHTVQEIFADYNPFSAHLFTIPINKLNPFQIVESDLRRCSEVRVRPWENGDEKFPRYFMSSGFNGITALAAQVSDLDSLLKDKCQLPSPGRAALVISQSRAGTLLPGGQERRYFDPA